LGSSKWPSDVPCLVKSDGSKLSPSVFTDGSEFLDRLVVQAHGVVDGELVSRHALLDVTRSAHARNVRDARERRAVNSLRRSTVKWDGASTAALEVVPAINTLVRVLGQLRTTEDATGGVTLVTQNVPLPLVGVTLVWALTGAVGERSALSVTLLVGRLANTFSAIGSITVLAGEVTRIVLGADQGTMIRATAAASL